MFHFEKRGNGRIVLFLHGFLESSTMWIDFINDEFDANFQSICLDLPGHGKSSLFKEYSNFIEIAQEIKSFLDKQKIVEFDIVGHSLGGYIAIELHKLVPKQSKLILFHSNFWEDDLEKKQNRNRVIDVVQENKELFISQAIPNLFLEKYQKDDFVTRLVDEAKLIKVETIICFSKLMRDRISNEEYIKRLKSNFLFIQGKKDTIIDYHKSKHYLTKLNASFTESGHMGHYEERRCEIEILLNFLK